MRSRTWTVGVLSGCLGAAGCTLGSRETDCSEKVTALAVSPGKTKQAGLVEAECGATVGFYTFLVVGPAGKPPRARREDVALMLAGRRVVGFSWRDDTTLLVRPPRYPPMDQKPAVNGAQILFEVAEQ